VSNRDSGRKQNQRIGDGTGFAFFRMRKDRRCCRQVPSGRNPINGNSTAIDAQFAGILAQPADEVSYIGHRFEWRDRFPVRQPVFPGDRHHPESRIPLRVAVAPLRAAVRPFRLRGAE
jgi:hypothetical protein